MLMYRLCEVKLGNGKVEVTVDVHMTQKHVTEGALLSFD